MMGWASGSRLAAQLIEAAEQTISDEAERINFYDAMIDAFENANCDTLDECMDIDPVFDMHWETRQTDWSK